MLLQSLVDFIERFRALMQSYPDEKRHPLVAGSDDWDKTITPTLVAWGKVADNLRTDYVSMRCIIEAVYCMGYERGQRQAACEPLTFTVADDQPGASGEH